MDRALVTTLEWRSAMTTAKYTAKELRTIESLVGATRAIEDPQEANPRVLVKWLHDLSEEWIRAEYLHLAN